MKNLFTKEVKIGLAVLVTLILLYVGIEFLKGVNIFKPGNYYSVKYENVNGLAISAPVTINGFQVGLVRNISYDYESANGEMNVELSLDKNIKLPVGTKAILASDLLGTASIQLLLNTENTTEFYKEGAVLTGEYRAGLMGDLDSKIMPGINSILPKLDSILGNVNALTSNPALMNTVSNLETISANLQKSTAALNNMLQNQIPTTMANINSISKNLNIVSNDLTAISSKVKSMPIDSTVMILNRTLSNVESITHQLNSTESSLGMMLNDNGLYNHIDNTITDLDSILIDLRYNPKKYVNFKLF